MNGLAIVQGVVRVCRAVGMAAVAAMVVGHAPADAAAGDAERLFAEEIRPYLAERCYGCHTSAGTREGGLALDWAGGLREGGHSGPAVVPAKPDESVLLRALRHEDGLRMPKSGPKPAPATVAAFRRWIESGAPDPRTRPPTADELARETSWEAVAERRRRWWSLQPIRRPEPPADARTPHPIDAFIASRLAGQGLAMSPPADRVTLIRRLSFDLVGLPPTPEDVDAFLADGSPTAWENLVDRLLASPRYGERWGRHWLDVVRFTESQGFEYDHPRPNAWHYRDYVIESFNADKPYDVFMREQVAGDVIEPVTSAGIVATSLLVCGAWDQAGSSQKNATQRAMTREEEMEDLVGTVGQTFLGLTLNCARCHAHKFDAISQAEYYQIKAVFDGVRHGERPIVTPTDARMLAERRAGLERRLAEAVAAVERLEREGLESLRRANAAAGRAVASAPLVALGFDTGTEAVARGALHGAAAVTDGRLVVSSRDSSFFESAPLDRDVGARTLEAWVSLARLDQGGGAAISIESAADGDFDAIVYGERQRGRWMAGSGHFRRTRDLDAPAETVAGGIVHVAAVYAADGTISLFRNGQPYGAAYRPAAPLKTFPAGRSRLLVGMRHHGGANAFLDGAVVRAALHDRALTAAEVADLYRAGGGAASREEMLASLPPRARDELASAAAAVATLRGERDALRAEPVSYAGRREQPPPTRLLERGDVNSPGAVVTPRGLDAITAPAADLGLAPDAAEAARRRAFADWLADPRNPLPARVMVNRVWQLHFGQGLVATPNDLGAAGAPPTHPELLDWLASEFIARGWSLKSLHRLIVTSAAYRQSSRARPEALAVDAGNALLWRYAPRRLEAEAVRDAMLAASGRLDTTMGGPSYRPFTTTSHGATFYHLVDEDRPEFNRRTVYRMNINSGKEPLLDVLDCPDPAVRTPTRGSTITPLQALSLMNASFVQRQAAALAERATAESGDDLAAAVRSAYRRALGRPATAEEATRAVEAARERGLASVCWALLNTTEFVHVR